LAHIHIAEGLGPPAADPMLTTVPVPLALNIG